MNRTLVKTTAKQLKREVAGEITYQTLNAHLRKSGWSIWEFSPTNPNTKANKLIAELGIEAYANGKDSFAYCSGTQKIIFICQSNSANHALWLLAHEIGHILLNRNTGKSAFVEDILDAEAEANYFADVLLKPSRCKPKLAIVGGTILLAIVVGLYVHSILALDYYITADGNRYHTADCSHIQGRQVELISKYEATKQGYGPCQDCITQTKR